MTPSLATIRHYAAPLVIIAALAVAALVFGLPWLAYRFTHSISKDAFVESHLVNVSPQVAGNIVEIYVQEQARVKKGQLLALVDPSIYRREVDLASARLEVAKAALAKSESDLELLRQQVPQRIAAAKAKLAAARDNEKKADAAVTMLTQDVGDAVEAAERSVDAAQAAVVLADEDFSRYSALYADGSVSQRRLQEATKTHDVAQAERKIADAKLGQA